MSHVKQDRPLEIACPQCRRTVQWNDDNPYRPFCSKRCRLLDLGAWADGSHRIAGEAAMDETDLDTLLARADRDGEPS